MKRYFIASILFVLLVLMGLLTSCGGGSSSNDSRPIMTAMVNSTNWRCPAPNARISENSITIYGTSANGQTIQLVIRAGEKGEYNLNEFTGHEGKYIPNMSTGAAIYSTSGSTQGAGRVLISSINEETRTISGIFNFKAFRSTDGSFKNITDGVFTKVPYKFINTIDTTVYQSTLTAEIAGENWIPQNVSAIKNDTAIIITADYPENWESLKLVLPVTVASGIHQISSDGPIYGLFQQGFYTYPASNGSLTIGTHNFEERRITGTFFFNFIDNSSQTISVTSGVFQVYYNDQGTGN